MTEPKITVTEGDRRAAAEASRRHVSPSIEQWIKDGVSAFHKFVPIDIGVVLKMNAHAIARARTMAAFEATCMAVRAVVSVMSTMTAEPGAVRACMDAIERIAGAPMQDGDWEDVSALVERGWKNDG